MSDELPELDAEAYALASAECEPLGTMTIDGAQEPVRSFTLERSRSSYAVDIPPRRFDTSVELVCSEPWIAPGLRARLYRPTDPQFNFSVHVSFGDFADAARVAASRILRLARQLERLSAAEYKAHHGQRAPGSWRTKRLRKKRRAALRRWWESRGAS
ncbi:MAG: hypothetical protein AAFV77_09520 [Planctomycetota bacterium]